MLKVCKGQEIATSFHQMFCRYWEDAPREGCLGRGAGRHWENSRQETLWRKLQHRFAPLPLTMQIDISADPPWEGKPNSPYLHTHREGWVEKDFLNLTFSSKRPSDPLFVWIWTNQLFVPPLLVAQLRPTLCNPLDCSPPGSSDHGILQARILEQVAIPFSKRSTWPRDWTQSPALQTDSSLSGLPEKLFSCSHP